MDRSKPKAAPPSVAPAPSPPHLRRTQFTIFGLMVLMFVLSLSFSQLFYWSRAEQRWKQQEVQRVEREKAAAQAEKDAANAGTAAPQPTSTPVTPPKPPSDANSGDAAIAILMAVALPMLVMIIASVVYNVRKSLRRWRR